jgi:hypothetical protein
VTAPAPTAAPAAEPTAPAAPALDYAALAAALAPHLTAAAVPGRAADRRADRRPGRARARPVGPGPPRPRRPGGPGRLAAGAGGGVTREPRAARGAGRHHEHRAVAVRQPLDAGREAVGGRRLQRRFVSTVPAAAADRDEGHRLAVGAAPAGGRLRRRQGRCRATRVKVEQTEWTAERLRRWLGHRPQVRRLRRLAVLDRVLRRRRPRATSRSPTARGGGAGVLRLRRHRRLATLPDALLRAARPATPPPPVGWWWRRPTCCRPRRWRPRSSRTPRGCAAGPDYIVMNTADWLSCPS